MGKETFIIYKSFYKPIQKMSDKQLGRLFRAIFKYQLGEEVTVEEDIEMAFEFFKSRFELDESKYQGIVERNRNNGRKAGAKKVAESDEENPVAPSGGEKTQWHPVAPSGVYNDNDSDNENENEIREVEDTHEPDAGASSPRPSERDSEQEDEPGKPEKSDSVPYAKIRDLWNETCEGFNSVHVLSKSRKAKISVRVTEMGGVEKAMETIGELFRKVSESKFLNGDNDRSWKASFDWVFENDKNWVKVMEGNYDNREPICTHADRMKTNITNFMNDGKRYEEF